MKFQSKAHALKWLELYDTGNRKNLLDKIAQTEQGCIVLSLMPSDLMAVVVEHDFNQILLKEAHDNCVLYLETCLLQSDYTLIEATNRMECVY